MKFSKRLVQTLLSIDQTANTLIGSGWADEALSAYVWRTKKTWAVVLIDGLFFWMREHCKRAYESELERQQLPPEYRIVKGDNQ